MAEPMIPASLPMETQHSSAQRMYDKRASQYDDSWHPAFAQRMAEWADLKPGYQVLDFACGTGLVTVPAARAVGPSGHVLAIDVSEGMLNEARSKVRKEGLTNVEILNHDIARLDELDTLQGKQYDAIIMASALVLLTEADRIRAGKVWAGLLKPGGVFVVDVLTPYNQTSGLVLERTAKRLGVSIPFNRDWVKDETSITSFLDASGFVVEQMFAVKQTGEGTRYADNDEAEKYLELQLKGEHAKALLAVSSQSGTSSQESVRRTFREEWEAMAINGKVKIEDKTWIAVARKAGS